MDRILGAHAPYPALAVDADENIAAMNIGTELLLSEVSPQLLVPPCNVMRICLHPEGLVRQVLNQEEWRRHLVGRLYRQAIYSGRESLKQLYDEVSTYWPDTALGSGSGHDLSDTIVASIHVRGLGTELKLFSTIATFGCATTSPWQNSPWKRCIRPTGRRPTLSRQPRRNGSNRTARPESNPSSRSSLRQEGQQIRVEPVRMSGEQPVRRTLVTNECASGYQRGGRLAAQTEGAPASAVP